MITRELLVVCLVVELIGIGLATAVIVGHGGWLALRAPRRRRRLEAARAAVGRALSGDAGPLEQPAGDMRSLSALSTG
ncbi:MAG TPA: hypothetical protein VIL49_03780, partial [Capillimicrobium sp.]